jgi:sucrose-6-phosphate hydrolase SacC (GH32 family)
MFPLALDGDASRKKWIFQKGSGDYMVGAFDREKFTPETEPIRTHWGGNFYGGQTFADAPNGRRVHIAWMSTGKDGPNSWPGMPFNQQMSFPRELTLRTTPDGPRLFREPVSEIARLYAKTHNISSRTLPPGENALAGIRADLLDIELEIELRDAKQLKLNLRGTEILYDVKAQKLKVLDRALSLAPVNSRLHLRVLLDLTSIELFANHGETTHSVVFFPSPTNHDLSLSVEGGAAQVVRMSVHELKPAPPTSSSSP